MKQIYDFEQYSPPALNERIVRAEIEQRKLRWQTAAITLAGILVQIVLVMLGLLTAEEHPIIAMVCFAYVALSATGGSVVAIIYTRKGGAKYV